MDGGPRQRPERGAASGSPSRWPFAGRAPLLDEVVDALVAHRLAAVLLRGSAGVGKSRLALEAGSRLPADHVVQRVTATRALSAVPLGALAGLLAPVAAEVDFSTLDAVRLLAQVKRSLSLVARGRRLVILVDDLPWLDPLSMNVLVALLEQDAAALLATSRDDEPVPDSLLALWSADRALRIDVPALDAAACRILVIASLGGPAATRTVDVLFRASGGNPLHLRELVAETRRRGSFTAVHGVWRLRGEVAGSPALAELVERRLATLSAAQRDLVERIALCQPLTVEEVTAAAGPGSHALLADLEEQGLLGVDLDQDGGLAVRLAHPQYETVLRSSVPRLRAADLMLQHVTLLESRSARRRDDWRAGLWRLEATGTADPELLLRGARLARLAHDFTAVIRLAQATMRSGGEIWPGRAEALLLLGEAQRELGRPEEAATTLAAAAQVPAADDIAARIVVLRAHVTADEGAEHVPTALALLDAAVVRLPDQRDALLTARADLLTSSYLVADVLRVLGQVEASAGASRWSPATTNLLSWAGRVDEALASARSVTSGGPGPHPLHGCDAEMSRSMALLMAGRYDDAVDVSRTALSLAVADDLDRSITLAEWHLAAALLHAGRPRSAARWCQDVVSGAAVHGPHGHVSVGLSGLALSRAWLGDLSGAHEALHRPQPAADPDDPWRILAEAWVSSAEGAADAATQRLVRAGASAIRGGNAAVGTALLQGAVRLGRPGAAVDLLDQVAHDVQSPVVQTRARHARAAAARDIDGLSAVADAWAGMGSRLDAAEAAAQAVHAATAKRSPRAVAALANRAQILVGRCEGARPVAAVGSFESALTNREREISLLAARGLQSKDIAERLFLSVRTVNNHLQASYLKLGVSSRRELAATLSPS